MLLGCLFCLFVLVGIFVPAIISAGLLSLVSLFLLVFGPFALVGFLVPGLLVLVFVWSYCYFFFGLLVLFGL